MYGPEILARTMSVPRLDGAGRAWSYHSRSDRHSKVACFGLVFDLLRRCALLKAHVAAGKAAFGLNHEMSDFRNDRKKNLDLVICTPASDGARGGRTLASLAVEMGLETTPEERAELAALPVLVERPVGTVLLALEAKACMTAHRKALPRLYDELNSSHLTVHGAHSGAIAAGFVMINAAEAFASPGMNRGGDGAELVLNKHRQPAATEITIAKVQQLPRRSSTADQGYDALAIVVVDCRNDGSPVAIVSRPPAPQPGDAYHYAAMIDRLAGLYATRFAQL